MVLYLSIVAVASVLICSLNIIFLMPILGFSPWFMIGAVILSVIYEIAVDGFVAFVICRFPDKWFSIDKKRFNVSKREQRFYEILGIRKWKDKVWELGGLNGFSKSKISNPADPKFAERFLIESNKGYVEHIIGIILGFTVIFIFPFKYALTLGLPVAIVNMLLNSMSAMILRYNIPKLQTLYKRAMRNMEHNKNKESARN